jgi:CPA2 family monovalent cation:H+ antiporter-2
MVLTLVTILGQSISSTLGALLSGQPLKQSVQTGMSLSQIGEFSFIIATLGITLKVTNDFLYPIVVAVSAVTTFTTPFMVRYATPFSEFLSRKLPRRWLKKIERYSANAQSIRSVSNWQIVLKAYLTQVIIHSAVIIGAILLSSKYIWKCIWGVNHSVHYFPIFMGFITSACCHKRSFNALGRTKIPRTNYHDDFI